MKNIYLDKVDRAANPDPYLYERLVSDLNYCGIEIETQKGFLFYLGAAITIGINDGPINIKQKLLNPDLQKDTFLEIINAFSHFSGNISDYDDLDDTIFSKAIYTYNFIFFQISGLNPNEIDKNLRNIEVDGSNYFTPLKSDIDNLLKEKYTNSSFNLNTCHNLLEDIFSQMGIYLHELGFDLRRLYEAGYAFFCAQSYMDINGIRFLLSIVYNSLTPLYKALFNYPILNFSNQVALKSNHILSNTLQMFYTGISPDIIKPIHLYHQLVFYVPNSNNLRPQWDFPSRNDTLKQASVFMCALSIRETDIIKLKKQFLTFDDCMCPDLKNQVISKNKLFYKIQTGIIKKYGISVDINNPENWNNLGDLLQYFCILFYETCLHAIFLKEITADE
jgi:hypothetical protein